MENNDTAALNALIKEFRSRNITNMTEDEFRKSVHHVHMQYKDSFPTISDALEVLAVEEVVDIVLTFDRFSNNTKARPSIITTLNNVAATALAFAEKYMHRAHYRQLSQKLKRIWYGEILGYQLDEKKNYSVDSNGFRVYDQLYDSEDYIACFGCENTFGTGISSHNTWPFILSQKLQMRVDNCGDINASVDTVTRYIWQYLQYKTPSAIFIMFPDISRFEFFTEDDVICPILPGVSSGKVFFDNVCAKLTRKHNSLAKFYQNYALIKVLCENKNIPFFWYTESSALLTTPFDEYVIGPIANTYSDGYKLIDIINKENNRGVINMDIANLFYTLINEKNLS